MNKREIKSFRTDGRVNTRGIRVTNPEKIRTLNSDAIPFMSESELLMASLIQTSRTIQPRQPSTSGCTASGSGGKHVWYKKGHCYYQCGNCKYYKTYHENYDSPTCTSKGYCDCGNDYKPALGHLFYSNEKYCQRSGCNAVNPNYVSPVPKPVISSLRVTDITTNSCLVSVSASNAVKYDIKLLNMSGTVEKEKLNYSYSSFTFTGLVSGRYYQAKVVAYNSAGDYDVEYSSNFQIKQQEKVEKPSVTYTAGVKSVTMKWTNKTGASTLAFEIYRNGTKVSGGSFSSYLGTGTVTQGLTANTYYTTRVWFTGSGDYLDSDVSTGSFQTSASPTFSWSTTPVAGNTFKITASDWTRLQNTINDKRTLKGYSKYNFSATANVGGKLTASMFNDVRQAISAMGGTNLPSAVSTGQKCEASHFTKLSNSLNNISVD